MSFSSSVSTPLVGWLRAAGEPTRLRLLALCAERDLSVSNLAKVVGQSEPRVSRHLKILSEAGLIVRLRQGQWVHYQLALEGAAAGFVQGLIAQLDRTDAVLARDRESLRRRSAAAQPAAVETRLGRALRAFIEETDSGIAASSVLIAGVEHPELLSAVADAAKRCVVIAHSRRSAQAVRTYVERENLNCRVVLATSDFLSVRDADKAGQPFEAIVLDRLAAMTQDLTRDLTVIRQALAPGGRFWVFERYDSLENLRGRVVEHPIARIRRILSEAGFACEKLSPIEADGEHVLAACAVGKQNSNVRAA